VNNEALQVFFVDSYGNIIEPQKKISLQ